MLWLTPAQFGGDSEIPLKRAAIAIQQMSGKGVISMEELRQQLGEAVPYCFCNAVDGRHYGRQHGEARQRRFFGNR